MAITVQELVTLLGFEVDNKSISKYNKSMNKLAERTQNLGKSLTKFVSLPLFVEAGFAVKAAADLEQLEVAFTTMLGSAEKADAMIRELTAFAVRTPFTIEGVQKNAKQLLAMGIESKKILPTLKALGDVSAGLSVPLERVAFNFGQVKTQGKLTGLDLRQFLQAGIPMLEELAKVTGKSKKEIRDMVSAGNISFEQVEQAFINMSSEGGKFANLMDKQSKTLAGVWSNLTDSVIVFNREIGATIIETFQLDKALLKLTSALSKINQWFKALDPNMRKLVILFFAFLALLGPLLFVLGGVLKMFVLMRIASLALGRSVLLMIAPWALLAAAILAVGAILFLAINDFNVWKKGGDSVLGDLLGKFEDFDFSLKGIFKGLTVVMRAFWDEWAQLINKGAQKLTNVPLLGQLLKIGADAVDFTARGMVNAERANFAAANGSNTTNNNVAPILNTSVNVAGSNSSPAQIAAAVVSANQDMLGNALNDNSHFVVDPATGFAF